MADGTDLQDSPLEHFLGYQLRRASAVVMDRLCAVLARHGLRSTLYAILASVEATPGIGQASIGRQLGIHSANMAPLATELEAAGWLERRADPQDRRSRKLFLAKGRKKALVCVHADVRAMEAELETLVRMDVAQLRAALAAIRAAGDTSV